MSVSVALCGVRAGETEEHRTPARADWWLAGKLGTDTGRAGDHGGTGKKPVASRISHVTAVRREPTRCFRRLRACYCAFLAARTAAQRRRAASAIRARAAGLMRRFLA